MAAQPFDPVAVLVEHRLLAYEDMQVYALRGGYLNQVFRVTGYGVDWVVKRFMPETELALFPNLPADEAEAMKRVAALGLAPKVIAFLGQLEAPVLVYEFYEGAMWREGVAPVAHLIRRLRSVDAAGFREVANTPAALLAEGDAYLPKLSPEMRMHLAAVRPTPVEIEPVPRGFLHTDIGPGNIIVGGDGALKVIDWQCPAAGDPVEDLVVFLSPAFQILYARKPLGEGEVAEFFDAYDDPAMQDRYGRMRRFYDWRMAGYCAMRKDKYEITRPDVSYRYDRATAALLSRLEQAP